MEYLIEHWSISSVAEFIRNEKSFERKYIFLDREKTLSLSQIIGNTYHEALMEFFDLYAEKGEIMSYDKLTMVAHAYLANIGANKYKAQKKLTIEEQQQEALRYVNFLLKSFLEEFDCYKKEIKRTLFIEKSFIEKIKINGIEIPIPIKVRPDIVFINHNDELCILDHKSKRSWSEEGDVNIRYGNQAIGYTLAINEFVKKDEELLKKYPKIKEGVKHFYFYENKFTKNKNGARQIHQIPIDLEKSGQLLEQLLFEGVMRMIEAVGNPDYVYLVNSSDYFQDSSEIMDFWVKTHIEGLDGFPDIKPNVRKILEKRKQTIRRTALNNIPKSVIQAFSSPKDFITFSQKDMENLSIEERIEHRLRLFNYLVKVEHRIDGYSCDTFLLKVPAGTKISSIFNYKMDIANAAGVPSVRISNNLVEYNNDVFISIEVNKKDQKFLYLENLDFSDSDMNFAIGKDNFGETIYWDISNPSTPHLMIAGGSGSGKSVTIKTLIKQALSKQVETIILDPKHEFLSYGNSCIVLNSLEEIEAYMAGLVEEMDDIFRTKGAIGNYGKKKLVIFDESADCFARQTKSKEFKSLEENTLILSQKARSAGIHLVLAAQRFSVKVLNGDAKANFSTRLCLRVASGIDSKVMLDIEGAERLNGRGDALILAPGMSEPIRVQCFSTN